MVKTEWTHIQLAAMFKKGICPYCGSAGATLSRNHNRRGGYHGNCPKCHATPNFSSRKVVEMIEG